MFFNHFISTSSSLLTFLSRLLAIFNASIPGKPPLPGPWMRLLSWLLLLPSPWWPDKRPGDCKLPGLYLLTGELLSYLDLFYYSATLASMFEYEINFIISFPSFLASFLRFEMSELVPLNHGWSNESLMDMRSTLSLCRSSVFKNR